MSEEIKTLLSIDCWSCGTFMTLGERSENDGDCPCCDSEIDLEVYLAKALAGYADRDARIAELERYEHAFNEWHDKTEWVQLEVNARTIGAHALGKHRADVMTGLIDQLRAELAAAKETIKRYETTAENCDVLREELANQLEVKAFWIGRTRALEVELAAIKAQEPVAWMLKNEKGRIEEILPYMPCASDMQPYWPEPFQLYAAPVATQVVMPELWQSAVNNVAGYAHLFNSGCGIISEIRAEHARLNAADQEGGQDE